MLAFSLIRLLGLVLSLLALEEAPDVNRREDIGLDLFTSDEAADISISDETGASILPAINQQIISCEALLAELKGYLLHERSGPEHALPLQPISINGEQQSSFIIYVSIK